MAKPIATAILLLCIAFWHSVVGGRSTSLSQNRVYSELKEIIDQGLSLATPFNSSQDECGIRLSPLRNNLLEWHFSFTGMEGSNFDGGIYHGKIILDSKYPQKAPAICMLTPSGRWKVGEYICLSASSHHPELWDPSWNLRTLVLSLRGFMTTQANEIGSIRASAITQRALALSSREFICPECNTNHCNLISEGGGINQQHLSLLGARLLLSPKENVAKTRRATRSLSSSNDKQSNAVKKQSHRLFGRKNRKKDKTVSFGKRMGVRKALLYSTSILLFGVWKLCASMIERYFQTATSIS